MRGTIRRVAAAGFAIVILVRAAAVSAHEAGDAYHFGVVPQFDTRQTTATWQPLLAELERRTGLRFRLVGTARIPEFEREYEAGHFDFAYMNPYHMLRAGRSHDYVPLVRDREPLQGILVVHKDSAYRSVRDLAGKVLAFPAPNALGASLLMRAELSRRFGLRYEARYVHTHTSVYLNVAKGLAAAGGGAEMTLAKQPEALRKQLRVLHTTQRVPAPPVAAHRRVAAEAQGKVRAAFLAMSETESGRALLAAVPMRTPVPAHLEDYRVLESLGLEAFWVQE